ncbi:MAG: terminase [Alphaproteobacteria bacterium]|nr:terminase [Alphaproteobacteria bacterium]
MSQPSRRAAKRDQIFFTALENGYSINRACDAAGYARTSVYRWREEDDAFAMAWLRALNVAADLLEDEADRRGRDGTDEPVFYQGERCGAKRKYSDALLLARLKALKPAQYRDGTFSQQTVNIVVRDFINEPKPALEGAPAVALTQPPDPAKAR